jgi:MFS family permease
MAQAIMWEIFPLEQRGTAMTVWGVGIMMAPILGPSVGGYIADNWSWRWIFYINLFNPAMDERLRDWTAHFVAQGADSFTAGRRALAMLYREAITQAHVLSYADDFWLLLTAYTAVLILIPFMRRVRAGQLPRRRSSEAEEGARDPGLPAATD